MRPGFEQLRALIIVENNSVPFDRRVWREAQTLKRGGWQVSIISPKPLTYSKGGERIPEDDAARSYLDGIHIFRYHLTAAEGGPLAFAREYLVALAKTLWLMLRIWREPGFDVVQVCNPPDFFFPIGWLCRLTSRRFVFDHHDLVPEVVGERWKGWKRALLLRVARWAEFLTMQTAHVIIATNASYRSIALDRGRAPPEKVFTVRNGPLLGVIPTADAAPELRQGRRYLVGYLGIMGPEDGLTILMEAIRIAVVDFARHDVQFLLVGDGPLRPSLIASAREWEIQEYVTLPGMAVTMESWAKYLSEPDLCVAPEPPTAFNDHSTLTKIAEYMAMGKPIVTFDLKETRYTAQEAAAYVKEVSPVALAKAILSLLEDPDTRTRMGAYGRRRFENSLCWERQEPMLLRAYNTAVDGTLAQASPRRSAG